MSATNTAKKHKITYLADPGHGWGLVPMIAIMSYGIEHEISAYSYFKESTGMAALEEDCDLSKFVEAATKAGDTVVFIEEHTNHDAYVRNWPSFPEVEEPTAEQVEAFNEVNNGLDYYEKLNTLYERYKDCFAGMFVMIDKPITAGTFMHTFDGKLSIALESGGFIPTGVRFIEPSHIHHDVILEDLNKTIFNQDYPEHVRIVTRSMAHVQRARG